MTIEDPIEFLHRHKKCLVNQRELGSDATTFADALKAALRQDPDVILVGEMRDLETISTALTAAETGHLVFATLHTQDTPQTIDRIIDVFPAEQQGQVRVQLAVAPAGDRHPAAAADRRRLRPLRRRRGARADAGRPQPDPRGQDAPDLLGAADRRRAGHADDGRLARGARARRARSRASSPRRARPRRRSCGACSAAAASAAAPTARWRRSRRAADGHLRLQGDRPRGRAARRARSRPSPSRRSPTSSRRAG